MFGVEEAPTSAPRGSLIGPNQPAAFHAPCHSDGGRNGRDPGLNESTRASISLARVVKCIPGGQGTA